MSVSVFVDTMLLSNQLSIYSWFELGCLIGIPLPNIGPKRFLVRNFLSFRIPKTWTLHKFRPKIWTLHKFIFSSHPINNNWFFVFNSMPSRGTLCNTLSDELYHPFQVAQNWLQTSLGFNKTSFHRINLYGYSTIKLELLFPNVNVNVMFLYNSKWECHNLCSLLNGTNS